MSPWNLTNVLTLVKYPMVKSGLPDFTQHLNNRILQQRLNRRDYRGWEKTPFKPKIKLIKTPRLKYQNS